MPFNDNLTEKFTSECLFVNKILVVLCPSLDTESEEDLSL